MPRGRIAAIMVTAVSSTATLAAATLTAASIGGWNTYVAATERRIQREVGAGDRFLGLDFTSDAAADRQALLAGAIVIHPVETRDESGRVLDVPDALVHHWRGAVLIPGASLGAVFDWVRSGVADTGQEDVLGSAVLERGDDSLRMFMKLRRRKVVTAVYDTEHLVTFRLISPTRAASTTTATKIAELADPGTPRERELPAGEDRGFLWRWNTYWRYEQVGSGALAECESLSLSRDLPPIIGWMIRPVVTSTARESMERTLTALRDRLRR